MSDALDLFIYSGSLFSPVLLASSDSFFLSKEESSLSLHVARLDKHTRPKYILHGRLPCCDRICVFTGGGQQRRGSRRDPP